MPVLELIQKDIVSAMKARDEIRLSTARMIKSAMQKAAADRARPLDDAAEQQILKSLVKQRTDAADMFRKGGRPELAEKEEAERKLIEAYLPASASAEELDDAVAQAMAETGANSAKQMGAVIKAAQAKLAGKTVDGKLLSDKVKARLA
jgi:uncharacterized protein YqeY